MAIALAPNPVSLLIIRIASAAVWDWTAVGYLTINIVVITRQSRAQLCINFILIKARKTTDGVLPGRRKRNWSLFQMKSLKSHY